MATNDLTSAIEQSHAALGAILKGDPSVYQALFSLADDVTLGNPFGPYVRGRRKVEETLAGAASHYRDGKVSDVELVAKYVSDNLACVVEVERGRSKVGGAAEVAPVAVRVTRGRCWKVRIVESVLRGLASLRGTSVINAVRRRRASKQPWPNMRLQLRGAALLVQISRGSGGSFGGVGRPQLKRKPFGDRAG